MATSISAVIIDDEPLAANLLRMQLSLFCPEVLVKATINRPDEAIVALKEINPDVIFLDIRMPGMDGFELLRHFPNPTFNVIFVTAHAEYALQAIKVRALDYLLKSAGEDELKKAVKNAIELKEKSSANAGIQVQNQDLLTNLANSNSQEPTKDIWFKKIDGIKDIYLIEDIYWFEANGDYAWVYFEIDKKTWINDNLKSLEQTLIGHRFIRSHDKCLVNSKQIKAYKRLEAMGEITMKNGRTIPVSKGKRSMVEQQLKDLGLNF